MPAKNDGAIIFDCSTERGGESRFRTGIIRPLAPFALHEVFVQRSIPSTVINYTDFWDHDHLTEALNDWIDYHNIKNPVILVSTLFTQGVFHPENTVTKVIQSLSKQHKCTLLLGGPINVLDYEVHQLKPDAVFQGRSLHLFERWLDNQWDGLPVQHINGIDVYHDKSGEVKENPVVPTLYDDYCLTPNDVVHFETRLGCKFNCTFCEFEYRNAKKVHDSTAEKLSEFFSVANSKYGIQYFSCVDDTFNEDQSKIDTLHRAVNTLSFKPTIVGYNRFDLMMHKSEQVAQLDECGFHGHYFGIETLHREASKLIRKGIRKEQAYKFLRMIRDDYPHWWTCTGYIVGVPKEPKHHILEVMKDFREQNLVKSVIPVPLGLYNIPGNEHNLSDFSRYPAKYGITVTETGANASWYHDHLDSETASILANRIASKNRSAGIHATDPWEWACRQSVKDLSGANLHINNYIEAKTSILKNR